jgi:hypothetical protein
MEDIGQKGIHEVPNKLWMVDRLTGGFMPDEEDYTPEYHCEVLDCQTQEDVRKWCKATDDWVPAICRDCAVRLGLEW